MMSANGPKRTFHSRRPMSAFGVRADIFGSRATLRLRRSRIAISCPLLGVKRTWLGRFAIALQMSANDPKRTLACPLTSLACAKHFGASTLRRPRSTRRDRYQRGPAHSRLARMKRNRVGNALWFRYLDYIGCMLWRVRNSQWQADQRACRFHSSMSANCYVRP
jgi:hypothetical protein